MFFLRVSTVKSVDKKVAKIINPHAIMEIMTETKKSRSLENVGERGLAIYEKIKAQYEPQYNGKILAIDIETGLAYMADRAAEAVQLSKDQNPDNPCYILRIGFDFVYMI